MNRRQYIRSAAGVCLVSLTAGCTGGTRQAGPTETVVFSVENGGGDGAAEPPTREVDAPEIEISATEFNRFGPNEFVVVGAVRNASETAFDHLELQIRLYEAGGDAEGFFNHAERQREFEYLAATETWTFRLHFNDVEIEDVSHYSVTAVATLATPTP